MVNPFFFRIVKNYCKYVCKLVPSFTLFALTCQISFFAQANDEGTWYTVESAYIEQSPRYTQRGVGYYTYNQVQPPENVELTNNLRLVITQSSHQVLNADGMDDNNYPYFELDSVDKSIQVYFKTKRAAFAYSAQLQQFVPPEPDALVFNYNFNDASAIQTENNNWEGWVYPAKNRGVVTFEAGQGQDTSGAYLYEDTSTNTNIEQNGIRFNNRTNKDNINPWTDLLANAQGETLESISLWVKVEKAVAGNVTVRHNLIPFPLIDDKKGPTLDAGLAVGPQYEMTIPASANNTWVQIEFVDTKTGLRQFTIPDSWQHYDGNSDIQVYPQILFDGLEVGDKVYVDDYAINAEPLENPCCEPIDDNNTGNNGDNGGSNSDNEVEEPEYNLGDELIFNYDFNTNNLAANQGSQGWIYSIVDRGIMAYEEAGKNGAAISYTDASTNINPEQNGLYLQQWSGNPFTARFANHGHIITDVKIWVKTQLTTEKDLELIHYLLPYGLVSGNKQANYPAAVEAAPKFVGTIPAGSTGWVQIDLQLQNSETGEFIIPSDWVGVNGGDLNIYPEFKFANTDVGDKIYIDDYQATSVVGEPLPVPTDFAINYDFNDATVAQNGGWGFVLANYGTINLEEGTGYLNTNALGYTDTSDNENINNQSLLWHKWGNTNPWSQAFGGGAIESEIQTVNLRVKVEKAAGNTGTDDITIKHHLLPWNITLDGGKYGKVTAAQAVSPDYTATISASDFGQWVDIQFIDAQTNLASFSIPETWVLTDGNDITDVLPSFFFGGLEEGDKVIIDEYELIGDNALARSVNNDDDEPLPDYGFHDGSGTYTHNPRPTPLPVVDSDFYTEPTNYNVTRDLFQDYGVNNLDTSDDSVVMQTALDDISQNQGGGKLTIPAGDYYFRNVHLRSNVHIEVDEGAVFHLSPGGAWNVWMFEMGNGSQGKAENFSLVGLGEGFTIDLSIDRSDQQNERIAVFKMGDIENFKFSNFKINDNKTVFASFLVGITERDNDIHWPVKGIIENIDQSNSLFGYGLVQMYAADNILFRNLHSQGGITLRIETDNLTMKDYGKGGVRDIFAEDIRGTDCLAPVMFGPHFQENGSVQVNGVTSNGCGYAVRVDEGFVELFSPAGESYTRNGWRDEVSATYGEGCGGVTYGRGVNQWATRITHTKACLDAVHQRTGLKPGWFEESYVYNVTANYDTNAHLKLNNLNYLPNCDNICIAASEQWPGRGQIFLGDSVAAVENTQKEDELYHFNININNLNINGFPDSHHEVINGQQPELSSCRANYNNALPDCSDSRWNYDATNSN